MNEEDEENVENMFGDEDLEEDFCLNFEMDEQSLESSILIHTSPSPSSKHVLRESVDIFKEPGSCFLLRSFTNTSGSSFFTTTVFCLRFFSISRRVAAGNRVTFPD